MLLVPGMAAAGVALAPVMQSWNHQRRQIDTMLAGDGPYDQKMVQAAMQRFAAEANAVSARIKGQSGSARDFAARFQQFARDANSAATSSATSAELGAHVQRLFGDCQACHAIYNN
jgi:cytochrome c556